MEPIITVDNPELTWRELGRLICGDGRWGSETLTPQFAPGRTLMTWPDQGHPPRKLKRQASQREPWVPERVSGPESARSNGHNILGKVIDNSPYRVYR